MNQSQEVIERLSVERTKLSADLAKALASNASMARDRSALLEQLFEAQREIERLETRAMRVALSSAPPAAEEPEEDDNFDGPDYVVLDAVSSQEAYQAAHAESRAISSRGR